MADGTGEADKALCTAIRRALHLADECGATLVGALLDEAYEAARCSSRSNDSVAPEG